MCNCIINLKNNYSNLNGSSKELFLNFFGGIVML